MKKQFLVFSALVQCFLIGRATAGGLGLGELTSGLNKQLDPLKQELDPLKQELDPLKQELDPLKKGLDPLQQKLDPIQQELNATLNAKKKKKKPGQNQGLGVALPVTVMPSIKEVLEFQASQPHPKKDHKKKKSYLDEIEGKYHDLADINTINEERHKAGYIHIPDEANVVKTECDDLDKCEKEEDQVMWAAAPTDPLEKLRIDKKVKKAAKDRLYELAVNKGKNRAEKELKKQGGADPYGGLFPPDMFKEEEEKAKAFGTKDVKDGKGTKTAKGSKKGKGKGGATTEATTAAGR